MTRRSTASIYDLRFTTTPVLTVRSAGRAGSERTAQPNPGLPFGQTRRNVRSNRQSSIDNRQSSHRGVSSVLAMMFLVLFGSLAAAMAVVAQSNLRTADSGLKLSRAMSAAETGMVFATQRLAEESKRFVVVKGVIDAGFGDRIWMGTYNGGDGPVTIVQPSGYNTGPGVIHALRDAHNQDGHNIAVSGAPTVATIDQGLGRLRTPATALADAPKTAYFILIYEYAVLLDTPYIRVSSTGVDGDIRRTLVMDFKIDKKIEFAILSPNRVMIGKNVLVEGPLGTHFGIHAGELNSGNGDPLVMRSDFYYLDDALSVTLDTLYEQVRQFDVDGDNRLRPDHPTEAMGLSNPDLVDYDGDQYVDDFDLFLKHFDSNGDRRLVYDAALASAAGEPSLSVEYGDDSDDDGQMLRLIDEANPDRDGDDEPGTASDIALGYKDGILDFKDQYAKVRGRLAFAVDRSSWEAAHGASYQTIVKGPIRAGIDVAPVRFEVTSDEMGEITTQMFSDSATWFETTGVGNFSATSSGSVWEPVPYGAVEASELEFGTRGAYDYYQRPVYQNTTFTNVRIPRNTNALFRNCTFVGVTWIDIDQNCEHQDWNYVGALKKVEDEANPGTYTYIPRFPNLSAGAITNTRERSNNIRFDNCTFLGSLAGDRPLEYTHWRNKIQMTGNTRFYLDPDDPDLLAEIDNPQPDTDPASWRATLSSMPAATRAELEKSSILMPGWSIDVGSFTNEAPKIKLKGTIIAGVLDVRGTADVHGTLLMTYRPVPNDGPLFYGGLPDAFNTTIGYFHSTDGDSEGGDPDDASFEGFGEITLRYNPNAKLPDGIPWPIRIDPDPKTYVE